MKKITQEEFKHIAYLSRLEFDDVELQRFEREFNSILDYVSMIGECDTSDIDYEHHLSDFVGRVLQDDTQRVSLPRDSALQNATNGRNDGRYIKTSKIVNKE